MALCLFVCAGTSCSCHIPPTTAACMCVRCKSLSLVSSCPTPLFPATLVHKNLLSSSYRIICTVNHRRLQQYSSRSSSSSIPGNPPYTAGDDDDDAVNFLYAHTHKSSCCAAVCRTSGRRSSLSSSLSSLCSSVIFVRIACYMTKYHTEYLLIRSTLHFSAVYACRECSAAAAALLCCCCCGRAPLSPFLRQPHTAALPPSHYHYHHHASCITALCSTRCVRCSSTRRRSEPLRLCNLCIIGNISYFTLILLQGTAV